MWYGHIRALSPTAEGCMGGRLPNVTLLHWAKQPWWCKAMIFEVLLFKAQCTSFGPKDLAHFTCLIRLVTYGVVSRGIFDLVDHET